MTYLVHAPGLGRRVLDDWAALGAAMWVGMHVPDARGLTLNQCRQVFLQAHLANAVVLVLKKTSAEDLIPVAWLSFAAFSPEHEARYVRNPAQALQNEAWSSGDRLWMLHLICTENFADQIKDIVLGAFRGRTARSLSPQSHRLGQKIRIWRGHGVGSSEANAYWKIRPILA